MGKKRKVKNAAAVVQRRLGDVSLSNEARAALERFFGGKAAIREFAQQQQQAAPSIISDGAQRRDTVRLILANKKMIVVKRAGDLSELYRVALPKLRTKRANVVYAVVEDASYSRMLLTNTLEVGDDTEIVFEYDENAVGDAAVVEEVKPDEIKEESQTPLNRQSQDAVNEEASSWEEVSSGEEEEDDLAVPVEGTDSGDEDDDELVNIADDDAAETVPASFFERAHLVHLPTDGDLEMTKPACLPPMNIDFAAVRTGRIELPIDKSEHELVTAVREHSVTIVRAPTGSGKSTRLVQYLLEQSPADAKMVVTQPRRIAAMTVSDRVASELRCELGKEVGYSVRTESKSSKHTRVLFCTVGVLLRRLAHDAQLSSLTHVIVDEAHERDVLTDLLLIFLKELVLTTRKDLKIVVLSATLDSSSFRDYFSPLLTAELTIQGMTHPIQTLFLEELEEKVGPCRRLYSQHKPLQNQELDVDFIGRLIGHYLSTTDQGKQRRSVLIFVSGRREIIRTMAHLKGHPTLQFKCEVYALHSSLSHEDQKRVFRPSSNPNKIKVIVSTNVAETSVTIDDVGLVIDSGKFKESRYDADARTWHLEEVFISKSAMIQRRGRAGRTAPGICYHLYRADESLLDQPIPGMLRDSLEDAIMSLKAAKLGMDSYNFFAKAISPPPAHHIMRILEDLSDLGVIRGEFSLTTDSTELTPLGFHVSRLGTDSRTAKLLLYGCFFDCLDPVLTIASALDGKSPFQLNDLRPGNSSTLTQVRKIFGADDFAAVVKAREVYLNPNADPRKKGLLSQSACRLNEKIRDDFVQDLHQAGFLASSNAESVRAASSSGGDESVLRTCLAAGLFPHVGRVQFDGKIVSGPHSLEPCSLDPATMWTPDPRKQQFFVFHERTRLSSKMLNIRKACPVSPIALILFGGGFTRVKSKKTLKGKQQRFACLRLGTCWNLSVRIKDSYLLILLRKHLDESLLRMYERQNVNGKDEKLLRVICQVIRSS